MQIEEFEVTKSDQPDIRDADGTVIFAVDEDTTLYQFVTTVDGKEAVTLVPVPNEVLAADPDALAQCLPLAREAVSHLSS